MSYIIRSYKKITSYVAQGNKQNNGSNLYYICIRTKYPIFKKKIFSVLADETADISGTVQWLMKLYYLRYDKDDKKPIICEEFIEYISLQKLNAPDIFTSVYLTWCVRLLVWDKSRNWILNKLNSINWTEIWNTYLFWWQYNNI